MSDQPVAEHDAEATEVITAELVACTLGQRQRPELRTDPVGRVLHLVQRGIVHVSLAQDALMREVRAYRYPTA